MIIESFDKRVQVAAEKGLFSMVVNVQVSFNDQTIIKIQNIMYKPQSHIWLYNRLQGQHTTVWCFIS